MTKPYLHQFSGLPGVAGGKLLNTPRTLSEWSEEDGDVLWWRFPIEEPPYVGTPLDQGQCVEVTARAYGVNRLMRFDVGGWPGYHTHWTPIPMPTLPGETKWPPADHQHCQAGSDGECYWPHCPQAVDHKSTCPLYDPSREGD